MQKWTSFDGINYSPDWTDKVTPKMYDFLFIYYNYTTAVLK